MLSNLAWTLVLAFSPLGCNKAAHSNQPSVDCGFNVSYVFEASGQSQIWAVVHLLVQILNMFGMLFASEHTFSEQEWVQQFTDGFTGPLSDLLTPHHLPGTCWLPLFLVLWLEPGVVFVLLCPVCQLCPCPRPNGRWTGKKRSSGESPPPSWDNSSPDWEFRVFVSWLPLLSLPVSYARARGVLLEFCLCQCPFLGFWTRPVDASKNTNSTFLFSAQTTLLNSTSAQLSTWLLLHLNVEPGFLTKRVQNDAAHWLSQTCSFHSTPQLSWRGRLLLQPGSLGSFFTSPFYMTHPICEETVQVQPQPRHPAPLSQSRAPHTPLELQPQVLSRNKLLSLTWPYWCPLLACCPDRSFKDEDHIASLLTICCGSVSFRIQAVIPLCSDSTTASLTVSPITLFLLFATGVGYVCVCVCVPGMLPS